MLRNCTFGRNYATNCSIKAKAGDARMKLDGSAVQYYLAREFGDVTGKGLSRVTMFDYPILYDVSADMGGHVVLVPSHERPSQDADMSSTLCVCVGAASAASSREAGAAVVLIRDEVAFQHLYNRMQHIFVENERLDAQLRALVDTRAGFQPLLDACARAMGHPCALVDEQYRLVCAAAEQGSGMEGASNADALEDGIVDLLMASREYRYMRTSRNVFTMPSSGDLMMKNVFSKGRLVGSLVVEHNGDALSARFVRFVLNYLGSFVEDAYDRIGSFGVSPLGAEHVKAAIQGALSKEGAGYAGLEAALLESGHQRDCDYVVLRIERSFTNEGIGERDYVARRLELAWPYAYCFMHEDGFYMLVDISEGAHGGGKAFAKELPLVARENLVKVGISRAFSETKQIDAAVMQARIALESGGENDPTNWCYRFDDYVFPWLVAQAVGNVPPEYTCHPAVTELLRYDEAHGTDLLLTLSTFIRLRYNASTAARDLFVARSTLLHRLARIEELTRIDFDNPADMAYLSLSLAMIAHL